MSSTTIEIDPVALIQRRAAERFDGDESLEPIWAVLLDATEEERYDFLGALLDSYAERKRQEREARFDKFVADLVAEATKPRDSNT